MGRRSEQRIALRVPILVRGKDGRGSPFVVNAHTHDITATGASLNGLKGIAEIGSKIEIEYQGRKAMFRIQWIGSIGTPRSGQAGVKCLEPGNYIWGVPLAEWAPDTYDPDHPSSPPALSSPRGDYVTHSEPRSERRRFPRVACRIEATVADVGSSTSLPVKVTDISLGGCYVEMLSPLPIDSAVEISLDTAQGTVQARGRVAVSQMGMGMSVAFSAISPEDFEKLREIAPPVAAPFERERSKPRSQPIPTPAPSNGRGASQRSSQVAPTTQEVLEAILRILLRDRKSTL